MILLSSRFAHRPWAAVAAMAFVAVFDGGCAAVRPVKVTPPPAPPAYGAEFHAAPAQADQPSASPRGGLPPPPRSNEAAAPRGDDDDDSAPDAGVTEASAESVGNSMQGGHWWAAFADPALDGAIQEAFHNNYLMRDLRTLIYENQLDPTTPKGILWPLQIGVPAQVQHYTFAAPPVGAGADATPGYTTTLNQADVGVTASYQVDVWGQLDAQRRTSENLVEQQRQNTEVFAQTLAEQVTELWFEILEQRALRNLLESQVRYSQDLLDIIKARFDQHLVTRLVVLQQQQQLLNTQAQVPLVLAQLALLNSKLTALLGRMPNLNSDLVPQDRRLPDLPPGPPVGAPVDLLRDSPELRLAKVRVAEAEHLVNQNLASWLPTVEIVGAVGARSYDFSQTFMTSSVGARLTWPIFDGGQRITRRKQLELTVQRRNWQYELAIRTAVQRVQDSLIQEHKQADNLRSLRAQVDLGRLVLHEARLLFEQGVSDYLPVLTALASLSTLERASVQAQRLLLSYRVQLYHALGGNWSRAVTTMTNN